MLESYSRIGNGAYFFSCYIRIIINNRNSEPFAELYEYIVLLFPQLNNAKSEIIDSDKLFTLVDRELVHDIFLFFWALALSAHCKPQIFMIDIGELGYNREFDRNLAENLSNYTNLDVDFSDVKPIDSETQDLITFIRKSEFSNFTKNAVHFVAQCADYTLLPKNIKSQIAHLIL